MKSELGIVKIGDMIFVTFHGETEADIQEEGGQPLENFISRLYPEEIEEVRGLIKRQPKYKLFIEACLTKYKKYDVVLQAA